MSMNLTTSLGLLKYICYRLNLPIPTDISSLTPEQAMVRRYMSEANEDIVGLHQWYWRQREATLRTVPYASGSSVTTSGGGATLAVATDNPFVAALTKNGKMTIDTGDLGFEYDVIRINATTEDDATILSEWNRAADASADPWTYGQDEYELAADCDEVAFMIRFRGSDAHDYRFMIPQDIQEIQQTRANRSAHILSGDPVHYCVLKHERSGSDMVRKVVIDPFPSDQMVLLYGYYAEATDLDVDSDVSLDIPSQWTGSLIAKTMSSWLKVYGIGSVANTTAGKDVPARIETYEQDFDRILRDMESDHARVAGEIPRMQPDTMMRTANQNLLGRTL